MIIITLKKTTGRVVSEQWAERVRKHILDGHEPDNPVAYVRAVIENEPNPRVRFLAHYGDDTA